MTDRKAPFPPAGYDIFLVKDLPVNLFSHQRRKQAGLFTEALRLREAGWKYPDESRPGTILWSRFDERSIQVEIEIWCFMLGAESFGREDPPKATPTNNTVPIGNSFDRITKSIVIVESGNLARSSSKQTLTHGVFLGRDVKQIVDAIQVYTLGYGVTLHLFYPYFEVDSDGTLRIALAISISSSGKDLLEGRGRSGLIFDGRYS